jgi:hypothetical protein
MMNTIYEIRVKGHLGERWAEWFAPLVICCEANGETILTGPLPDQAALHGVLVKVRDLNLVLLAVNRVEGGVGKAGEEREGD